MTATELGNQQAFSLPAVPAYHLGHFGLTKREYFASQAMAGLVTQGAYSGPVTGMAEWAVECADQLLAALSKEAN